MYMIILFTYSKIGEGSLQVFECFIPLLGEFILLDFFVPTILLLACSYSPPNPENSKEVRAMCVFILCEYQPT